MEMSSHQRNVRDPPSRSGPTTTLIPSSSLASLSSLPRRQSPRPRRHHSHQPSESCACERFLCHSTVARCPRERLWLYRRSTVLHSTSTYLLTSYILVVIIPKNSLPFLQSHLVLYFLPSHVHLLIILFILALANSNTSRRPARPPTASHASAAPAWSQEETLSCGLEIILLSCRDREPDRDRSVHPVFPRVPVPSFFFLRRFSTFNRGRSGEML